MSDAPGNQTPNTPDVSETELREMKVDELRDAAKEHGVSGHRTCARRTSTRPWRKSVR